MARALYKKQENLLDQYKYVSKVDDLPLEVWEELKTIYDWECLYSHADCYLRDNFLEKNNES